MVYGYVSTPSDHVLAHTMGITSSYEPYSGINIVVEELILPVTQIAGLIKSIGRIWPRYGAHQSDIGCNPLLTIHTLTQFIFLTLGHLTKRASSVYGF
jgi:hypothetical protein